MNEKENNRIKVDASMEHRIYFKDNWGIIKCSIEKVRSGDGIYKGDLIIFKGQMPQPIEGCIYTIIADFVHDPKWGDQYVIQSIFTALDFGDGDDVGKKKYLSSLFPPYQIDCMYGALDDIEGIGPRYCPSIEDKVVRCKDKERHQLFIEPESRFYADMYLQGFSTSMPPEVQEKMVHSLPGFENAKILKYGYAIEYDAIYPTQLNASLETKVLNNLFTAGQINGTSGYEEAACQGLMAGINAGLKLEGKEPLVLKRNEAYIGVLIDDLITKGIRDPYRLLTSRAEFRLLLRSDNADLRLRRYGYEVGLIDEEQITRLNNKEKKIEEIKEYARENKVKITKDIKKIFDDNNIQVPTATMSIESLLKRPEITIEFLEKIVDIPFDNDIKEQLEIYLKYEGYIKKAYKEADKLLKLEKKQIPEDIDYSKIKNIASEARQKLAEVRPKTIAQAIRISGVNPTDISILSVYLKKEYNKNE